MRYAANIERALSSWEISPEEWADYIAFLARLLKAIQSHRKDDVKDLPHSDAIATRLAQCLNPALPSGVHQKALEVYTYIFSTFGNDHIASHIHDYLPGLTAVLSFASLSVRPGLYALFENNIVGLSPGDLRPALKSLILSLLPALEDENGEDFERAFAILQSLERSFTPDSRSIDLGNDQDGYFWQCLFLSVITSSSRRQGALNYLTRTLPKLTAKDDSTGGKQRTAACIISPEPGLLIRCFICGLSDSQILIQRGFLDLLVTHLPLDSYVLQEKVGSEDLDRLVTAATQVLLRRDMSLNRRLWSWFLGPEPKSQPESRSPSPNVQRKASSSDNSNSQLRYFSTYGKASLQRCVLKMLNSKSNEPSHRARPFRICLSLMDRWEIGGLLVSQIFLPAMRSLYEYSLIAAAADVADVIRSASLFFDGVEASLIWECLLGILSEAFESKKDVERSVQLFRWIIQTFNVRDEEMLTLHIPQTIVYLVSAVNATSTPSEVRVLLLDSASSLLEIVPARVLQPSKERTDQVADSMNRDQLSNENAQRAVLDFYHAGEQATGRTALPFKNRSVAHILADKIVAIAAKSLVALDSVLYSTSTAFLIALLGKVQLHRDFAHHLKIALVNRFEDRSSQTTPFSILSSSVRFLSALSTGEPYLNDVDIISLEPALTSQLWGYMSPMRPKYHVEAVKLFWQLESLVASEESMVASLAGLLRSVPGQRNSSLPRPQEHQPNPISTARLERAETVRRFAVLWNHSISPATSKSGGSIRRGSAMTVLSDTKTMQRNLFILEHPLMLVLDALEGVEGDIISEIVASWLQGLSSLEQVFQILFKQLAECLSSLSSINPIGQVSSNGISPPKTSNRHRESQVRELNYILGHFQNMLTRSGAWTWQCLSKTFIVRETKTGEKEGLHLLAETCVMLLCSDNHSSEKLNRRLIHILGLLMSGPAAEELKYLELDSSLLERLMVCISGDMSSLQGGLLKLVKLALKLRLTYTTPESPPEQTRPRASLSAKRPSIARSPSASTQSLAMTPPPQLFKCLQMGFSSTDSRYCLDQWLSFLADILPTFADALFSNLLPLVECFCDELAKTHAQLVATTTHRPSLNRVTAPEAVIMGLLEGLEMVLDRAYECLLVETADQPTAKETDTRSGFLSNVAAGMFKAEGPPSRTAQANSRLTVILTFQDAIRVALKMWLWASNASDIAEYDATSSATTAYNALKVRNKSRHLLEQIFAVEPLESLEVIVDHWSGAETDNEGLAALSLLHVMAASRPKNVVPAVLDALCSRTHPSALPPTRQSSLTLDISPSDVATFLSAYLASIEDDAMDEVWSDCITFLRDVLSNPLPYRQVLPNLLAIILLLAEKLSNTNFGEQRKMRRDLGDIFQRLLTATFTTLPSGYVTEPALEDIPQDGSRHSRHAKIEHSMTLLPVLIRVTAKIDLVLESPERITSAINNVTASLISSIFRARSFPKNIGIDVLTLLAHMTHKAPGAKAWKKEVSDAFNDPKLLAISPELMALGWYPALHQWSLHDKDRGMPELLTRLTPPSSAGIMFGVGASAARLEADRRTQLNIRRICILLLASPEDTYVAHLRALEEKLAELFDASPSSSPSAAIKAELFILCRTLAVSVSAVHIAPLWPIINAQLQKALKSMLPEGDENDRQTAFGNLALLQSCKLLDVLIGLGLDEFLLHEWLYVTDTVDAVYAPDGWRSGALADLVGQALGDDGREEVAVAATGRPGLLLRDLAIDKDDIKALPREEFVRAILRPFLSQLSISAYEGVYSLERVDSDAIRKEILGDLLDLGTVVE